VTRLPSGRTKVNTWMDDTTLEALRRIGAVRGVTYSELIRQATREFVLREGGKVVQESLDMKRLLP